MKDNENENIMLDLSEPFDPAPLCTDVPDYSETIYKILGIPVCKVIEIRSENGFICKRYYFLGLPFLEINEKMDDEDCIEDFNDENND